MQLAVPSFGRLRIAAGGLARLGVVLAVALCAGLGAMLPSAAQSSRYKDCDEGDPQRRIKACTAIIKRGRREPTSNHYLAHANRGMAYLELEDFDLAVADLSKAIAYEPKQPLPRAKRGEAYARKGDHKRAVEDFSASLEIEPHADTYRLRAESYMELGQYDLVLEDYGKAMFFDRGKAKDHMGRAKAFLKKQDPDRAIEHLDLAIEIDPKESNAYADRAEAYWMKRNRERYRADLQTAIKLLSRSILETPAFKALYGLRAHYHLQLEAYDEAIADFNTAYGRASSMRGLAYWRKGEFQRALADLGEIGREFPDSIVERQWIGQVRFDAGDFKAAVTDLRPALARRDDYTTMLYLFLARSRLGEPGAAAELETNAARLKLTAWPLPVFDLYLGRRTAEAAMALATGDEESCEAHFHAGEWELLRGETVAAERNLKAAVEICHPLSVWKHSARFELARLALAPRPQRKSEVPEPKKPEPQKKAEAPAAAEDAAPGRVFRDCPECPEMVVVPAGSFMMGSPGGEPGRIDSEGPQRQVTIARPFAIGKFEVTRGELAAFVAATGHKFDNLCSAGYEEILGLHWQWPGFRQTDRHPAVCVNWRDASAYAAWLAARTGKAYRLPSEAEWEYAARAGSTSRFHFGDDDKDLCLYANFADLGVKEAKRARTEAVVWAGFATCRDGHLETAPVGSLLPNAFGLYDVHGNVREWVQDCSLSDYADAPTDGSAWMPPWGCDFRVVRGGGWTTEPARARSASRAANDRRDTGVGFRVARVLAR